MSGPSQSPILREIIASLDALKVDDREAAHAEADALLLAALHELGQTAVVDAWHGARRRVGFWYA